MSELAKSYFRWFRGDKSFEWAREGIEEKFDENLEKAWEVTLDLIAQAPSKDCLSYVAAGQLEMLVSNDGERLLDLIREEAKHNKNLLYAMSGVWISKDEPIYQKYYECLSILLAEQGIGTEDDFDNLVDLPDK